MTVKQTVVRDICDLIILNIRILNIWNIWNIENSILEIEHLREKAIIYDSKKKFLF